MPAFRDAVLDRIHSVSKTLAQVSSPENPTRSHSTVRVAVDECICLVNELEVLGATLKRVEQSDKILKPST